MSELKYDNMTPSDMTAAQHSTLEMLLSSYDVKTVSIMPEMEERPAPLVFEGDGVDGPCCGYIEVAGGVTWIAGG